MTSPAGPSNPTPPAGPGRALAEQEARCGMAEMEAAVVRAVEIVTEQLASRESVFEDIRRYPGGNLANRLDLSNDAMANRIVGVLLAAGWTPGGAA